MSRVEKFADDFFILTDTVKVDGRVSWLAPGASGYEPYNEYLLRTDTHALLIETGVALHGPSILSTLKELVGDRQFAVLPTRIELDALGNLGMILEAFPDAVVGSANPVSPVSLVHLSDWTTPPNPLTVFGVGRTLEEFGFSRIRMVDPGIRTLGTVWLLDDVTNIMITADFFTHDMMPRENDSVIRRDGQPHLAPEGLRTSILQKFDWIAVADLRNLHAAWDALFARIKPTALAPVHGRIQYGDALVQEVLRDYRSAVFLEGKAATPRPAEAMAAGE